jgi:hypothetical protein
MFFLLIFLLLQAQHALAATWLGQLFPAGSPPIDASAPTTRSTDSCSWVDALNVVCVAQQGAGYARLFHSSSIGLDWSLGNGGSFINGQIYSLRARTISGTSYIFGVGTDAEGSDGIVVFSLNGGTTVSTTAFDTSSVSTSTRYTAIAVSGSAATQQIYFTGSYYRIYVYSFTSSISANGAGIAYVDWWSPANTELNSMAFASWVTNTW